MIICIYAWMCVVFSKFWKVYAWTHKSIALWCSGTGVFMSPNTYFHKVLTVIICFHLKLQFQNFKLRLSSSNWLWRIVSSCLSNFIDEFYNIKKKVFNLCVGCWKQQVQISRGIWLWYAKYFSNVTNACLRKHGSRVLNFLLKIPSLSDEIWLSEWSNWFSGALTSWRKHALHVVLCIHISEVFCLEEVICNLHILPWYTCVV